MPTLTSNPRQSANTRSNTNIGQTYQLPIKTGLGAATNIGEYQEHRSFTKARPSLTDTMSMIFDEYGDLMLRLAD